MLKKIIKEEKIVEIEEIDESKIKIIDHAIFKQLDINSQKLVIDAEENEPNSLIFVAQSFLEGSNNFPKDISTGIKYLEHGITIENVQAMELYGKLLFEGDIIPKDEEKSVEILTKAAEEFNSPNAKYELANIILSHQSFDINDKNENINYVLAKKYAKEAADGGNTKAMVLYSKLSLKNKKNQFGSIKIRNKESFKYRKLAAENEDPEGLALYGKWIELGDIDMKPDPNEAIKYYKKSYSMNDMTGCAFLGLSILNGIGDLEKNEEEASKLMKLSMESGNPYGMIYYSNNIIKDLKNNFDVYMKTCDMGSSLAFFLAGFCYFSGQGVEKDLKMAIKYFKRALEEGSVGAAVYIGDIYKEDHPEFGIKASSKKAKHYMKIAADNGDCDALFHYPQYLAEIGDDPREIKKYFKMGIKMGNDRCMLAYGLHLNLGKGVPRNLEKAAKYFKMAADLGNTQAMQMYAAHLAGGFGVEKDEAEASRYKLLATDQNNEDCLIQ